MLHNFHPLIFLEVPYFSSYLGIVCPNLRLFLPIMRLFWELIKSLGVIVILKLACHNRIEKIRGQMPVIMLFKRSIP